MEKSPYAAEKRIDIELEWKNDQYRTGDYSTSIQQYYHGWSYYIFFIDFITRQRVKVDINCRYNCPYNENDDGDNSPVGKVF
jgi:hypothetical protein